jgi:hypothetical protein
MIPSINPNVARKSSKKDMGKPFGKASGRTFMRNSSPLPLTDWNSLKVKSSNYIKNVKRPPSEALKGGLPVADLQLRGKVERQIDEGLYLEGLLSWMWRLIRPICLVIGISLGQTSVHFHKV